MELTLHLPISQWYKYDLSYWGLDYPPLIAYGSYLMGWASQTLVGHETVALFDSRGYEGDPVHKSFMRATVIFWDAVVYFPALYLICTRYGKGSSSRDKVLSLWLGCTLSPPIILVDNGHFQYNNVCLGLALSAFHFMTISEYIGIYDILGSVLFCLALNWKQMTLYYAPAVFSFLLGKCFRRPTTSTKRRQEDNRVEQGRKSSIFFSWDVWHNISKLGLSVLATFVIIWYPFYHYRQDAKNESVLDVFGPILKRIFPFSRGLFEGKVANLWCVGNIKPISIRSRIPEEYQPLCALVLTVVAIMPFCILLFVIGKRHHTTTSVSSTATSNNKILPTSSSMRGNNDLTALLWGATGTSLSFFLASFQVHEKSILLPLAPLTLLQASSIDSSSSSSSSSDMSLWVIVYWFTIACTWSLWHLMVLDRLQVVYFAVLVLYISYIWWCLRISTHLQYFSQDAAKEEEGEAPPAVDFVDRKLTNEEFVLTKIVVPCFIVVMVGLHVAEAFLSPPQNLPDLFPVLWIVVACIAFIVMWMKSLLSLRSKVIQLEENGHYKVD